MDYDNGETGVNALTKIMPVVQRLMSAAERGFHKALSALRQLQKERGFVPHCPGNAGFVLKKDTPRDTESREYPRKPSEGFHQEVTDDDPAQYRSQKAG